MIAGARQGTLSGLRRLAAVAMARDLSAFLVPGIEIARARGLDIAAAGMQITASPRHANVLVVVGAIPPALREAAAVVYAQMMRPRAVFALGTEDLSPLPAADVVVELSQQDLIMGVRRLRAAFAEGAFRPAVSDFDAPMLHVRIEYTCPMHPEIIRSEPGSCPKCGMTLMPREAQATAAHQHGSSHGTVRSAPFTYTCPMHPEIARSEPGSCPKCGMTLVPREGQPPAAHQHGESHGMAHEGAMDHGDMAFMSMIDVTKDLPRSGDGLPMDWIDVPFGPLFPGLPGGLQLILTLDGDTVAGATIHTLVGDMAPLHEPAMDAESFIERLADIDPLAPVSYRLLACRAVENAASVDVRTDTACARVGALERERIASHLGWLALFGQQTGFDWLVRRAASLQRDALHGDMARVMALTPALQALARRLHRTPLLTSRMAGIGRLAPEGALRGPVARAAGLRDDARGRDDACVALGFTPIGGDGGDALARLWVRVDEITQSLALIAAAGAIAPAAAVDIGAASGAGEAVVETPRGMASLRLTLETGRVVAAQLETPSTHHLTLIGSLVAQQELGDALVAIGSLDLSPWEIRP